MKLAELDPKWIVASDSLSFGARPQLDKRIGLRFLCPRCRSTTDRHGIPCEVVVYFTNPFNSPPAHQLPVDSPRETDAHNDARRRPMKRTGSILEALTLDGLIIHKDHWTGRVERGAVIG